MSGYKLYICFSLVFMTMGLALGADVYPVGSVSVLLPPSFASPLSVNNTGAQAALQTADAVLAPAGFAGYQVVSENAYASGELAIFTRDISFGSPTACNVVAWNDELIFSFLETGTPDSSSEVVQLCNELADALSACFGPDSVEVQLE